MAESFSLSLELICLMNWLLKHEKTKLRTLIEEALKNGFSEELSQIDLYETDDISNLNQLHTTILDFLVYLEDSLLETLEENVYTSNSTEKLNPTLQKINPQKVDPETIWRSMQQTSTQLTKTNQTTTPNQTQNKPEEVLLSKLLKNWNPETNEPVN